MPSSTSRRSTLSPRPITSCVLVELVHLAHVGARHHDQVGVFWRCTVGPAGACAVRVVSSSGSPTRSAVILVFYRPARGRQSQNAGHDRHERVFLHRLARELLSGEAAPPKMLAFYAGKLGAVEINNTFYRMPDRDAARALGGADARSFRFALKSPTQHHPHAEAGRRGRRCGAAGGRARARSADQLGPILFQLPPFLRKDLGVLEAFLAASRCRRADAVRAAVEFRHDVLVRRRRLRMCCAVTAPRCASPTRRSSRRRSRRPPAGGTCACADRTTTRRRSAAGPSACARSGWTKRYVFFKHEDEGAGPAACRILQEHDDLTSNRRDLPNLPNLAGILPGITLAHTMARAIAGATISFGLVSIPVKLFRRRRPRRASRSTCCTRSAARGSSSSTSARPTTRSSPATTWSRATSSRRTSTSRSRPTS